MRILSYLYYFHIFYVYGNLFNFGLSMMNMKDKCIFEVSVAVRIDSLDIRGLYTLASWLSRSAGNFTVKLTGVNVEGIARLEVATDGKLQAQNIDMDLTFNKIDMDFTNLGFLGSVFQGVINSVGSFIFDSIKPFILKEVNTNMRYDILRFLGDSSLRMPKNNEINEKWLKKIVRKCYIHTSNSNQKFIRCYKNYNWMLKKILI